jgi:hypothetical protein
MANEFKIKRGFLSEGNGTIIGSLIVTGSIYTDSLIYAPFTIGLDFETVETFIYRAPSNFKVTSIESDPSQSIEILYQASGSGISSSYSFGDTINKFDKLHVTPVSESLVILYSEKI